MIEHVEGFEAELRREAADLRILDERGIDVERPGPANNISTRVAVGRGVFGRRREAAEIELLVDRRVVELAVANPVGTVSRPRRQHTLRLRDRQRQAATEQHDAAELPAAIELLARPRDLVDPAR